MHQFITALHPRTGSSSVVFLALQEGGKHYISKTQVVTWLK